MAERFQHHDLQTTSYHEAGHAVLDWALTIQVRHVTIVPDYKNNTAGYAQHGGEWGEGSEESETLRMCAPEAFWLRHATACYGGAEAVRRWKPKSRWRDGASDDFEWAGEAIRKITGDDDSIRALDTCARRRSRLLVEHYWPEIEAVAAALVAANELSGPRVEEIIRESINDRTAPLLIW